MTGVWRERAVGDRSGQACLLWAAEKSKRASRGKGRGVPVVYRSLEPDLGLLCSGEGTVKAGT